MNGNKLKVASMFAGIGGICLAFKQAGCDIVWANELNHASCETYRTNFGSDYLVESDIKSVNPMCLPDFDILAAGFPCQSFSIGGKQKGFDDNRGALFFEVAKIIEIAKPRVVFLENVENLVEHDDGNTFIVIYNTLANYGYYLKYMVMSSSEYGNLPQNRKRIYIVALKNDYDCDSFSFPEPMLLERTVFDVIDRINKKHNVYYYDKSSNLYAKLNSFIGQKSSIFRVYNGQIRNVRTHNICPTLTASMNSPTNAIVLQDNFGIRRLTVRECLALQGFPNEFKLAKCITVKDAYMQIGNSVSVPVVKRIAERIVALF